MLTKTAKNMELEHGNSFNNIMWIRYKIWEHLIFFSPNLKTCQDFKTETENQDQN